MQWGNILITIFMMNFCESKGQIEFAHSLVYTYFSKMNVKYLSFFTCWKQNENLELIRIMSHINSRCTFLKSTTKIQKALQEKYITQYGYVLDATCHRDINILKFVGPFTLRKNQPWLILLELDYLIVNIFRNIPLRMDSNIKLAISNKNHTFTLLDIYNPSLQNGKDPVIQKVGFWNGSHLDINQTSFYLQRKDMSSIKMRTATVLLNKKSSENFEDYIVDTRFKEHDTLSKFFYQMFLLIENVHNFTHSLRIEKTWFGDYLNGTDAGLGKLMYEDKIDMACTGVVQRPYRRDIYGYLIDAYRFRACFIFRNPKSNEILLNEFLKPFSPRVWQIIAVLAVTISIFLKLFHRIENRFVGIKARYSWPTALMITASAIFQQDSYVFPRGYASRIVFLVLQILAILLYDYYTSSVISSLLSRPPRTLRTLDELGHSKLEIGIEGSPYTITWFKLINDSDVQYIYKHKIALGPNRINEFSPEDGVEKVRLGGFAYHTIVDTGYPIIARTYDRDTICDLAEIPMMPESYTGILMKKHSQYQELFLITSRKCKERGLIDRIAKIWQSNKPKCLSTIRLAAVGVDQVFVAFLCLFIGMIVSLLFLIGEIVWFRLQLDKKFHP